MTSFQQSEYCTITWKIENFGYSGKSKGECLQTPCFRTLSKEWCLLVYPRGKNDSRYITVEIFNLFYKISGVDCKFFILDLEDSPLVWKDINNGSSGNLFQDLVTRDEVFGQRRATFLPDNTLTLEVHIFKSGEDNTTPSVFSFCTCIKENLHSLKWEIPNFNAIGQGVKMLKSFPPMTEKNSFLNFKLVLNEDDLQFDVTRTKADGLEFAFCSCKILMLASTGKRVHFAESEYFFEDSEKVWRFTAYVTKSMLMCDPDLYLPQGALTLMIEATHSGGIEYNRMVETLESSYVII